MKLIRCFYCGKFGHTIRNCDNSRVNGNGSSDGD